MILGLGCDIVNVKRLQKSAQFLQDFKRKILGLREIEELNRQIIDDDEKLAALLAKRYAAKEAFAKALGCGFRDGVFLRDIETLHDSLSKPHLKISGAALEKLHSMTPDPQLHLTVSDDYPYVMSVVIIEG